MGTPDARIESLLLHDGFVRALARSLLADESSADDVAQQTWVAALEKGGEASSLPRWLAGVVKNLAGKARRGERRRARREQACARPEATPAAEEILEREAARSRVVAAVLALEEPYRECVLLRYFESLSPPAIAARQGVPLETARTRLKRALELLRARLDREYGGERGAWAAVLAPFARPSTSALTPSSILAMSSSTKLAVAVAALALLALFLRTDRRTDPVEPNVARAKPVPSTERETGAPAEHETAEPAPTSARSAVATQPSPALAVVSSSGSLRVHVTWSDGTPAPEIHARVESWSLESPQFRALEAFTDASGSFVLAQVPCGKTNVMLDRDWGGSVEVVAGEEATFERELARGCDVDGVVVDHEAVPVAGAELWLSDMNAFSGALVSRSRADGSFHLRSCARGQELGARAAGHAPSLLAPLSGEEGATVHVRLVLLGVGGELTGTVLGPQGEPVPNASVLIGSERMEFRRVFVAGEGELTGTAGAPLALRTDDDGRFLATGLAPGRTVVAVRADGFALWHGEVQVSEEARATLDVRLVEQATLTGHVHDEHGLPVANASVRLQSRDGAIDPLSFSAADGSFHLEGLAPGPIQVVASTSKQGHTGATLEATSGAALTWEAVVGLGLELRGRVLDERGAGLAHWHVSISDQASLHPPDYGGARTDDEGRFVLQDLHDRPHRVEFQAPGEEGTFASSIVGGIRPTADEQLFHVADADIPSARLVGLVADASGNALNDVQLELMQLELGCSKPSSADERGHFELGPYAPGRYVLRIRAQGYPEHVLGPRRLARDETWDCGVITLAAAGTLVVRVQRAPGTESLQPWFRIEQGGFDRGRVEPAGELWRYDALAAGSFRLRMSGAGVAEARVPFEIRAGETTELTLPLRAGLHREIRATVSTESGAAQPLLRLTSATGEVVVDEGMWRRLPGEFQHQPSLAPGIYRVEAWLENGARAEAELRVEPGATEADPLVLELR